MINVKGNVFFTLFNGTIGYGKVLYHNDAKKDGPTTHIRTLWMEGVGNLKAGEMTTQVPTERIIKKASDDWMDELPTIRDKYPEFFI